MADPDIIQQANAFRDSLLQREAAAFCKACLIDTNEGEKIKANCKLPVYEPGGALNRNAVHAAAGGRGITRVKGVSAEVKRSAARKLVRLYRQIGDVAPESVYRIAGQRRPSGG